MPLSLQPSSRDTPQRSLLLENLMVVAVLAVTFFMWSYSMEDPVLLHLFYVPVVVSGFCLGRYRARLMAFLCILSGCIIFLPKMGISVTEIPLQNLLVFLIWASVLLLIAIVVGRLSDAWRAALASLQQAHQKDVLTDSLTGIANRRAYEFELARRISQWEREGSPLILLLLDIDFFKKFNDRYGHTAGDAVLQKVAQTLQGTIRKADLVARIGGEEFAIILPGINFEEAQDVAERIRRLIESQRVNYDSLILRVTISVGFAQLLPGEDSSSLTKRADAALYSSKEAGRNCVHYHDGVGCQPLGAVPRKESSDTVTSKNSSPPDNDLYCDETTGLPTQRVLDEELRRRTAERNRYGVETVLAVVKVDQYETTVESPARRQKSQMATIARMIGSELRETDLIVRYGSDGFAILMPSTSLPGAAFPLRRICTRATNYHDVQYPELSYAVSIGVAEVGRDEGAAAVLRNVKSALQSAIDAGGSCVVFHEQNTCHVPIPMLT
jgi:diguanylate cyclase (GGDEF)-like protein